MLLRAYAHRTPGVRYVEIQLGASVSDLRAALTRSPGVTEIALDGLDLAQPAAIDAVMTDLAIVSAAHPRVIVAGRARGVLGVQSLLARGLAVVFDSRDLAFDRAEIQALAERFGVWYTGHDLDELLHITEGWPVAATWIVRDAADARTGLLGAFERWAERRGYLLLEFVSDNLARDPAVRLSFEAMLADEGSVTQSALVVLELAGCPIARLRTRLRPYRVLRALMRPARGERTVDAEAPKLLALNLLGSFSCAIGERHVSFTRRRDQNLLVYVALATGACATRIELLNAFWPGVAHAVASQGLRTTLSRLRRAIGETSGCDPEHYLHVDANVALVLDHVVVDARRFAEHVELGRLDDARGETDAARRHYRIATGLYRNHLLMSEAVEPSLQWYVKHYRTSFEATLTRMVELTGGDAPGGERRTLSRRLAAMSSTA
jgi:hypothetical protein